MPCSFSSVQGNIGEMLNSIRFLNGPSTVTSDMEFTFLSQCALYVEPENFTKTMHGWVTPRYTPVKYLYQAPDGIPPPLGMRSAVPLGGMGTGTKIGLADRRCQGSISKSLYFPYWSVELTFSRVQNSTFLRSCGAASVGEYKRVSRRATTIEDLRHLCRPDP